MPHHFFVDQPLASGQEITLPAAIAHQINRVLRLRPGAIITLLDGSGWAYSVELLQSGAQAVVGQVGAGHLVASEPRTAITLYAAPLKGDHYAYTLQKATELGVAAFVPIVTQRTVIDAAGTSKLERWRRIVREAAEQSGRGKVPPVAVPSAFAAACQQVATGGLNWIPWEEATGPGLSTAVSAQEASLVSGATVGLFIGPEGGLTTEEITLAEQCGILPVTLGPRILRAETAAIVALTLILDSVGDLTTMDTATAPRSVSTTLEEER